MKDDKDNGYPRESWSRGFSQAFFSGILVALVSFWLLTPSQTPQSRDCPAQYAFERRA